MLSWTQLKGIAHGMADEEMLPPDENPGSDITSHVNDYLENLRARFDELTDRIEEASKTTIDRGRAELEEVIGAAQTGAPVAPPEPPAGSSPAAETPPSDVETSTGTTEEGQVRSRPEESERLAARLRELEAAEAADGDAAAVVAEAAETEDEASEAAAAIVAAPEPALPDTPVSAESGLDATPPVTAPPPATPETRPFPAPMPRPVNVEGEGTRRWVVGTLILLILLSGAFLAGRWWSSRGETTVTPTTAPPAVQTPAATPDDETIQAAVDGAVAVLAPTGVTAEVSDGSVTLSGAVPDAATRDALSDVVSALEGVTQIDNRTQVIVVEPPTPESIQAAADAARAETGFEHLTVSVENGVATVTGVVSVDSVGDGVFASIAPLTDALDSIEGIDTIVSNVQLRGDEAALRAELKALIDESPIIFASGSPELDDASIATLDRAATIINAYPGLRVLIAGHTDAAGDATQNEALATSRGQAVLGYLIARGVPVTRLQVVSYGELFPEAGAEQSLNRRIEFEVAP